jgi:hypothetical protein
MPKVEMVFVFFLELPLPEKEKVPYHRPINILDRFNLSSKNWKIDIGRSYKIEGNDTRIPIRRCNMIFVRNHQNMSLNHQVSTVKL